MTRLRPPRRPTMGRPRAGTFRSPAAWLLAVAAMGVAPAALAQFGEGVFEPKTLVQVSAPAVKIEAGKTAEATVTLTIAPTWHINSNPASPDYMIATKLELAGAAGVRPGAPIYPEPQKLKVEFEANPLHVYGGVVVLRLPLSAATDAANGTHTLRGKLTFQACNDQVCLAPSTLPVELAVAVTGGASGGPAARDTSAPAPVTTPPDTSVPPLAPALGSGFATGPGTAGAANPLAAALERGGFGAFATLFLIGLALNLTPCVYPMIGVTVSIFGARRAAPPLQVFGYALVYVLGMAVMYSSLGLVAALTGGLFGAVLQNPLVLAGIGVLLIALSLAMFGLYQLQVPPQLLSRLGGSGTTSVAGVFLSGLMVGIFAAPCVGPPVVALLAVVGAKADPWYGFWSFFVLAMGLGAPYLVLGTFTNLLKSLPRSGDWLIWTERAFGVILLSIGAFYLLLGFAPKWAGWVPPVALVLGGIYLGFVEPSARQRRGFLWARRLGGAAAAIAGVVIIATTPRESVAFEPFSDGALEQALGSGQPAMVDFTANWCAPCHELERLTFTDRRVRDAARGFRAFRVDLTHYDSPESERWRRQFTIRGVPTVLFLSPGGGEVKGTRVEGFLAADRFLERMRLAREEAPRAAVP